MKRDTFELLLGLGVMALGIGLLLFTFASALSLAASPGPFIRNQLPNQAQGQGPSAAFSWTSSGLNLTVQDNSHPGSTSLVNWQWDYGDGSQANGRNPSPHVYSNAGPYTVLLTVRDSNNQESTTFSPVDIVPGQVRSGQSIGDITGSFANLNISFGDILLPISVGLLTMGLYLAMAVVGGMITKAGWNLVRPRPETIRIRLKPKHLQQYLEEDAATASAPAPLPVPPPPPQA